MSGWIRPEFPCPDKHTSQHPGKEEARAWMFDRVIRRRHMTAMTVSPAGFTAFCYKGWSGPIWMVDRCRGCADLGDYLRPRYTSLDIRPSLCMDVREATELWCSRKTRKERLAFLDLDLAGLIDTTAGILSAVCFTLLGYRVHTNVFLTYVNHRDNWGRNATDDRIGWLRTQLPNGAKVKDYHRFTSLFSGADDPQTGRGHRIGKGSAMCIVQVTT